MPSPQNDTEKIESALRILKMLVRCYSHSYYDPSELESIGYEVIGELVVSDYCNSSWEGLVRICLRNRFRDFIRKENRRKQLFIRYQYKIQSSLYMEGQNGKHENYAD